MRTINLYHLAERIIAAKSGALNLDHPAVLEEALREALLEVDQIDYIPDTVPVRIVKTTHPGSALSAQVGGDHYKQDRIQHVEFCQVNGLTWCESAALKYLMRHRKKNKLQDVDKAIHYCMLLRQIEYPEAPPFILPTK